MSAFELNVYGNDDEIVKTFSTDILRWGIFLQAISIHEEAASKPAEEQLGLIAELIKKLFPGITDKDIENADTQDVLNTFALLVRKANGIGRNSKKK